MKIERVMSFILKPFVLLFTLAIGVTLGLLEYVFMKVTDKEALK